MVYLSELANFHTTPSLAHQLQCRFQWQAAMFWKFDLHTSSHLEALLDKEDVTLTELMDEEDVLQECKAQNRRSVFALSLCRSKS